MKKLFIFLSICLVAVSFNSCNDDDNDSADKIVGEWRLSQMDVYAEINNEPIDDEIQDALDEMLDGMITECTKKSTFEFFENGTYKETFFDFIDDTNTCEALETENGTWENLGNSKYDISGIDFYDFDLPEFTVESEVKVTFESNKMMMEFSATGDIEGVQIDILIKVTFIDNDTYVPDKIIGKWQFDQEFRDGVEIELTECAKRMTVEFFEDGIYEDKDFHEDDTLQCIADEVKIRTWKNLGSDMYETSNIDAPEIKVTFANNKMTVEFTYIEDGEPVSAKMVFIKVTS